MSQNEQITTAIKSDKTKMAAKKQTFDKKKSNKTQMAVKVVSSYSHRGQSTETEYT